LLASENGLRSKMIAGGRSVRSRNRAHRDSRRCGDTCRAPGIDVAFVLAGNELPRHAAWAVYRMLPAISRVRHHARTALITNSGQTRGARRNIGMPVRYRRSAENIQFDPEIRPNHRAAPTTADRLPKARELACIIKNHDRAAMGIHAETDVRRSLQLGRCSIALLGWPLWIPPAFPPSVDRRRSDVGRRSQRSACRVAGDLRSAAGPRRPHRSGQAPRQLVAAGSPEPANSP
jgi:hypothetical protein